MTAHTMLTVLYGIGCALLVTLVAAALWLWRETARARADRSIAAWMAALDDEADLFFAGESKGQMARYARCDLPPMTFYRSDVPIARRLPDRPMPFAGPPAALFQRRLDGLLRD